jgi:hypothetical protein
MSSRSLKTCIEELEEKLLSGQPLGPSAEIPFALFVYDPERELELRHQAELLATRVENHGHRVKQVDLGALFWECIEEHPFGPDGLVENEEMLGDLDAVLSEGHTLLVGSRSYEPGPLEQRVIDAVADLDPARDFAFLLRAAELFPVYRTSALLERLMGHVEAKTVLFYPGSVSGPTELRFMGVCDPSPNYRPTIFGC